MNTTRQFNTLGCFRQVRDRHAAMLANRRHEEMIAFYQERSATSQSREPEGHSGERKNGLDTVGRNVEVTNK